MLNDKNKLRSFTVIEMMIALLICSFVIGFAYYFLFLTNSRLVTTNREKAIMNDWFLFRRAMANDFSKADFIKGVSDKIYFFKGEEDKIFVKYEYTPVQIIRTEEGISDTFNSFRKVDISCETVNDTLLLVNNAIIKVEAAGILLNTVFHKEYSAEQYNKFSMQNE